MIVATQHFVALRKGKYGKILSAVRHTVQNCSKIPVGHEVKEFIGGHTILQNLAFRTRRMKQHKVRVAYCSKCFGE